MNRLALPIAATILFAAACATNSHAQAAQPAPPEKAAQPAPAPASAQPGAQDSAAPPSAPQPPAKKVWSNEDMTGLDPHAVSSVGKDNGKSSRPGPRSASTSKAHDSQWYKDKISKLQSQIPPLDAQIAALQAAIDGKPTGDAVKSTRPAGVKSDTWTNELAQFKKKRDDILAQIAALQDEARHNGVAPNALP